MTFRFDSASYFNWMHHSASFCLLCVPGENLFYHWVYWFTEPTTLTPGSFSIVGNMLFLCNIVLAIYH